MKEFKEHQAETMKRIHAIGSRLNECDNETIERLYTEWSQKFHSAGWMQVNDLGLRRFVEWAITAPCDWPPPP